MGSTTPIQCPVDRFLDDPAGKYHVLNGEHVRFDEFRFDLLAAIAPATLTDAEIIEALPRNCPVGLGPRNVRCIGNLGTRRTPRRPKWAKVPGTNKIRLISGRIDG